MIGTSIYDFLTQAEKADVINRTQTLDVSDAVQEALDYVADNRSRCPMGTLLAPAGTYRLDKPIRQSSRVLLIGAGQGRTEPFTPPNTEFTYWGMPDEMWVFGANGGPVNTTGGGIKRCQFNARAAATAALVIRDATAFVLEDLEIANGTMRGLYLNNTPTQPYPTFNFYCRNVSVFQRGWQTPNANGIELYTPWPCTIPAGIAKALWDGITIQHANGAGLKITGGDNHQWNNLFTFRDNSETGPGVWFATPNEDGITSGGHLFLNPACSGGMRFDHAHAFLGTRIVNLDDYDLNIGTQAIFGDAADAVVATTQSGKCYGKQCT